MPKILIIRFSSIGDIIQCMGIISGIRQHFPDAEIHWIARQDMASLLTTDPRINKIWAFDKAQGLPGLLSIAQQLRKEKFDYVYDAHSNIRSNILRFNLSLSLGHHPHILIRKKQRYKRFLLFRLGINRYEWPFRSVESYRKPLKKWDIYQFPDNYKDWHFPDSTQQRFGHLTDGPTVTLVTSANWEMKRWPVSHWQQLIRLLPEYRFILLGGPSDTFNENIRSVAPERITDLTGKANLVEACYVVHQSKLVISADTGFMHAADLYRIPTLALIGPTAFGFPTGPTAEILDVNLPCRPCTKDGRGNCKQKIYQKCMVDITPERVAQRVRHLLPLSPDVLL